MKYSAKKKLFQKVLVPIVYGCEQTSAIDAARAIAGEKMSRWWAWYMFRRTNRSARGSVRSGSPPDAERAF